MPAVQQQAVAELFAQMEVASPLILAPCEQVSEPGDAFFMQTASAFEQATGLKAPSRPLPGLGRDRLRRGATGRLDDAHARGVQRPRAP